MKLSVIDPADPLLRSIHDLPTPPNGLTPYDMVKRSPLPHISRMYAITSLPVRIDRYAVFASHLLAGGAAVQIGPDGIAWHLYSERQGYSGGFVEGMLSSDQVAVRTHGIVALSVPGVSPRDQGKTVYATEPNAFNLETGVPFGRVVYCGENGKAMVIFAPRGVIEPHHWELAMSAYSH